ncbi:FadR/GntR family transcriptional regulator [Rhodopseudomonas boonkerdii]|uniref:FadR/GntR family transcriptional regulator n=1 Tax=Rhodopseudomonas boonkerdii TaxID=475937 RepID=UPI003221936F
MTQIPRRSLVEATLDLIRARIEDGTWKVGDKLPREAELAEALQVGRNTVREAVRVLSHSNVLEVRQGDGTYVRLRTDPAETMRRIGRSGLRDHFELRAMLETEAARLAAQRRTDDDLAELNRLLGERGEIPTTGDLADFIDRDLAFHMGIAHAAHNTALEELYRYFAASVRSNIYTVLTERGLPEPDAAAHAKILAEISAANPERAAKAARDAIKPLIAKLTKLSNEA